MNIVARWLPVIKKCPEIPEKYHIPFALDLEEALNILVKTGNAGLMVQFLQSESRFKDGKALRGNYDNIDEKMIDIRCLADFTREAVPRLRAKYTEKSA